MSDNEIGPIQSNPPGTVTITPRGPDFPEFSYRQEPTNHHGQEVLAMLIDDEGFGSFEVTMSPTLAHFVALTLTAMLADIDVLRQQWADNHA
jgi:hypothetical protein